MTVVTLIIMVLLLLQGVAFVTLWERHLLGITQGRLGPNKVTLIGVLQPILDGVKLLKKETITLFGINKSVYYVAPMMAFILLGCEWLVIPYEGSVLIINYGFLFLLVIIGISVYPIMISGMNTKSKYGVLGAIRSSAQTISFEVVYTLLMLSLMVFINSYEVSPYGNWFILCWSVTYLIAILLELNRAPFDLSEAESELVSGYNVEYISAGFVLFFLKEYGSLIFFSTLISSLYFCGSLLVIFWIFTLLLYIRSCYPRVRYDMVISLFWFILMPVSINLLFVSVVIS